MNSDDFQDTEELLEDEDGATEEEESREAPGRRRIFTDKLDPPVGSLHESFRDGDLVLDPIFQRRKVWDEARSSRLIESAMLEVPLPIFYFAESHDGTREVIDGQQRLTAFFRFLNNELPLRGLKALPHLNGKRYKDLEKLTQKLVRDCAIRTIVFKKESDDNLRFEIFERLNTGSVPLNHQELRNCIYRGSYNDLLHELSRNPDYTWLMRLKKPEKRMKDVEYVLRFAAFYHNTYLNYKPSMARFLNEEMRMRQQLKGKDAEELREAFKKAVALSRSLFGANAFKRYYRGNETNPEGRWEPKKFNASLYDILTYSMSRADKNQVMANLDSIREALIVLMSEDDEFIEAIELSTSSVKMVTRRFDKWRLTLERILENTSKQPRCFTRDLKKQLYESNSTCTLCGQHIADLDDSSVDHIEQYWLGGKTIQENARLTHRYCNWKRPRKA